MSSGQKYYRQKYWGEVMPVSVANSLYRLDQYTFKKISITGKITCTDKFRPPRENHILQKTIDNKPRTNNLEIFILKVIIKEIRAMQQKFAL